MHTFFLASEYQFDVYQKEAQLVLLLKNNIV